MSKNYFKKGLALSLVAAMAVTGFAGCGKKSDSAGGDTDFTWWITNSDGDGQYYENYEEGPVVQYINQQYWDTENGGIGTKDNGTQLNFSFQVPVVGEEQNNFNTMLSTGEYPDILDMSYSSDSPSSLIESGIGMDITEYVNKYMPNYLAYLDAHPDLKPLVASADEDGNAKYSAIYALRDGLEAPWEGTCYRRDWIVKYGTPSEYVWDWDSDVVKKDGHPEVTPLAEAQKANNLNGWKKNEVTSFTADYGADPDEDYTDNVIFPSGTDEPITISDWEWMFEAFAKALKARGWDTDTSAYCTTIGYNGNSALGDLTSSFGGGNGQWYVNDDKASFDGTSKNFQNYVTAMQTWYKNGWLDSEFNTRSSDIFFSINTPGVNQGKVGLWCGLGSNLGTAIQPSCQNAEDAKDAYVMGAALPINDVYGTADQKFVEPDCLYQSTPKGVATVITTKAEGKDLPALFTMLDWMYTEEGAMATKIGLNEEQYKSVTLDPDLMADQGLKTAYTLGKDDEGRTTIDRTFDTSSTLAPALTAIRMSAGLTLCTNDKYVITNTNKKVVRDAEEAYNKYVSTGGSGDYTAQFTADENATMSSVQTEEMDYMAQNLPKVIKGEMTWDKYAEGMNAYDTKSVVKIIQKYVDIAVKAKNAK